MLDDVRGRADPRETPRQELAESAALPLQQILCDGSPSAHTLVASCVDLGICGVLYTPSGLQQAGWSPARGSILHPSQMPTASLRIKCKGRAYVSHKDWCIPAMIPGRMRSTGGVRQWRLSLLRSSAATSAAIRCCFERLQR